MATWQPDRRLKKIRQQVEALVSTYGWAVQGVFAGQAAGEPTFSYTVGLYQTHRHPEIVVFGVPPESARSILNAVGVKHAKAGQPIVPGVRYDGFVENFPVVFVPVRPEEVTSRLFAYEWFYKGKTPPVLQLVWTDTAGLFPWEEGFDHCFDKSQPVLGAPPAAH